MDQEEKKHLIKIVLICIAIIPILFVIGLVLDNNTPKGESSSSTSTNITEINASEYVLDKIDLKRELLQRISFLKSILTVNIASKKVYTIKPEDLTNDTGKTYYRVQLKGNCIGYWDDYNTKIIKYTFELNIYVYPDGTIKETKASYDKVN